ncbi:MAG TPA: ATP-grasp domain-containing protein, partial [Gammaproteobacteria bacterium]|nr:ATP-grasp domain-containing protein [Gammaproteobacteria bacterium]
DDLNFYTHYLQRLGADFIVQQYISGREFNVSIMADNSGEILYAICREKLDDEQKRPNTNAGCIIRNPDMEAAAIDVVKKMKLYPGCSNVEFLLDESGQYYVIDVNGGRHAAQDYNLIHSGINIPEMLIDISRDNTPDMIDNTQIKSGVICIKYLDELIVEMNDIDSYWEESGP